MQKCLLRYQEQEFLEGEHPFVHQNERVLTLESFLIQLSNDKNLEKVYFDSCQN